MDKQALLNKLEEAEGMSVHTMCEGATRVTFRSFVVLGALISSGCDGLSQSARYEAVVMEYPDGKVRMIPGERLSFLVKTKEGDIIHVKTLNLTNSAITSTFVAYKGSDTDIRD